MYRVYSLEDEYHPQGTCSKGCAVVRVLASHQCGPGSNSGVNAICRLSLFVVSSLLCSERFFSAYSGFPLSSKPTLPNSNSIWNARTRLNEFSRTLKYFLAKRITITLFYQNYLGLRGFGSPSSLNYYKPQGPPLGTFNTKMATPNGKRSFSTILWKNKGL